MKKKEIKNKHELPPFSGAVPKKIRKPRAKKAPVAVKPRNAGTLTESQFWAFIRSALRQKTRWWKPVSQVKMAARRIYKGENKRRKFEYQCAECRNYFPDKEVNVDHVTPAGSLNSANDLPGFVERLFCEADGLQVLCNSCHTKKTMNEKNGRKAEKDVSTLTEEPKN